MFFAEELPTSAIVHAPTITIVIWVLTMVVRGLRQLKHIEERLKSLYSELRQINSSLNHEVQELKRSIGQLQVHEVSVEELARRMDSLERKYDAQFNVMFEAVRELMPPPPDPPRKKIGF